MSVDSSAWTAFMSNLPATIASIGALLVAIATFITSLRNGKKADSAAKLAVVAVAKADGADKQIDVIRTNTDGSLSELKQDIALARQEIASLKEARGLATAKELVAVQAALDTPVPVTNGGERQ